MREAVEDVGLEVIKPVVANQAGIAVVGDHAQVFGFAHQPAHGAPMTTKCATGFTRIDDAWGLRKALGERREAAIGDFASEKWRFETCRAHRPGWFRAKQQERQTAIRRLGRASGLIVCLPVLYGVVRSWCHQLRCIRVLTREDEMALINFMIDQRAAKGADAGLWRVGAKRLGPGFRV